MARTQCADAIEKIFCVTNISPLLANIALHNMRSVLGIKFNSQGHLQSGCCALVRYADDFVVFHETREGSEMARNKLQSWLE